MPDVRIVAKAMNDLADDWHWVVLHGAHELEPRLYLAASVMTICGIAISDTPQKVRLFDMGAPDTPTCQRCLDGGLDPGLRAEIVRVLEEADAVPVEAVPVETVPAETVPAETVPVRPMRGGAAGS